MTCPKCGAAVQPYDRFCVRCGYDLQPSGAPTNAGSASSAYGPAAGSPYESAGQSSPYAAPARDVRERAQGWVSGSATTTEADDGARWASGSSAPAPNPYASPPGRVSPGTMVNGRPVGSNNRGGILSGLGAALVALVVLIGKVGGGIAALGFFKLLFYVWLFRWIFGTGAVGPIVLVLIILAIVGAVWRARTT